MTILMVVALAAAGLMPGSASAATISLAPSSASVLIGDAFTLDIVISDLGGEIVSAYDLDVLYDSTALIATGVSFGPLLGDESLFEVLNAYDLSTSGIVDLAQLSLLSDAELQTLQGPSGSFVLATLAFTAIDAGVTTVDFSFDAFNDIKGLNGLQLEVVGVGASVTGINPIPEPGSVMLMAIGMLVVGPAVWRSVRAQ